MMPKSEHSTLVAIEFVTGAAALAGGILLVVKPDGSLLHAKLSALSGSPFADWRMPGLLLALLVGGGFLWAAEWERRELPHARHLSMFAGLGLIVFELAELAWIGLQPLEMVFGVVGILVVVLAMRQPPVTRVHHRRPIGGHSVEETSPCHRATETYVRMGGGVDASSGH